MNKILQRAGLVLAFALCGTILLTTVKAAAAKASSAGDAIPEGAKPKVTGDVIDANAADVHAYDAFAPKTPLPVDFTVPSLSDLATSGSTDSKSAESVDHSAVHGIPQTIHIDNYNFVNIPLKVTKTEGTLILSDSPEYVSDVGILSSGTIQGDGRIYFYHVNDQVEDSRLAIVAENLGQGEDVVTVKRFIETVPSAAYFEVGRDLSRQDLTVMPGLVSNEGRIEAVKTSTKRSDVKHNKGTYSESEHGFSRYGESQVKYEVQEPKIYKLWPSVKQEIVEELGKTTVQHEALFSGMVDVHTTEPTKFSVYMIPKGDDALVDAFILPALKIDDSHLRGQFPAYLRELEGAINYNTDLGPGAISLANDRDDHFLRGQDPLTDDLAVVNKGNYGVSNVVRIHVIGKQGFALYFNPMGGAYAGTVAITSKKGRSLIDVPGRDLPYIGHDTIYDTQYLGTFESGQTIDIEFMSAGASNLPVRFLFIPLDLLSV